MCSFRLRLSIVPAALATAVLLAPLAMHGQTLVTSIPIGPQPGLFNPAQMIVNPANHKVYVVGDFGTIAVVDGTTNQTLTHIKNTNGATYGMLLNSGANQIYLLGGTIQVVDSASDTIVNTFTPSPIAGAVTTGFGAPAYAGGNYNPVTNRLYIDETYEINNVNHLRLMAIDGATGAELAVVATDDPTAPFIGAAVVNPANNKIYGIGSGGLNTVGGYEVYDGATNTRIAGTLFAQPQATDYTNGYLSSYQLNPADNSLWMTTWIQTSEIAADGHTVLSTPPVTRFYRVDGVTNQLTSQDVFGFFTGLVFDPPSGRLIGSASCIPTTATDPSGLSATPCSAATTTFGMAAFDPASPAKLILLNPYIGPASCSVLPRMSAGAFLGGGLLGMDMAAGYFYYTNCTNPFTILITKGVFTGTPAATFPPTLNAIQTVGTLPTPDVVSQPANLAIDSSTHRAYVNSTENYVMAIDPSVPSLISQFLGNRPASLAVNPVTNTVYVGDSASKTLNVIDGATNTTRPQIQAGAGPNVAVNAVTNRVIVAGPSVSATDPNQVQGAVLLDGTSEAILMPLQAAAAVGMAVNSTTNIAYFLNNSQWYSVDLNTGARLFTGSDFSSGSVGSACQFTGIAVNSTNNSYYIAGTCASGPGTLALFDGATNTPLGQVSLAAGRKTGRLAVNPVSNKIYWETDVVINPANPPAPSINVYDAGTLASLSSMQGGFFPVAFNTVSNLVYTTNGNGLTVWDGIADASIGSFGRAGSAVRATPAVAVNETTNMVYVTDLLDIGSGETAGVVDVYQQGPLFHLGGKVLNGATGLPGASITINGTRVLTDANGVFQFPARVPPGTYTIAPTNPVVCGGNFTCTPASTSVTVVNADVSVTIIATPNFSVTGKVVDPNGVGLGNIALTLQGLPVGVSPFAGPPSSGTAPDGTFIFRYLPAGNYTISAQGTPYGFVPQPVSVTTADVAGVVITGTLPIAITSYTLSPFTMIGSGVVTTGTITLNQPAPLGGITIALSASDPKPAKFPSTVTVAQGQNSAAFTVQGNGVSSTTTVTLTASYQGSLAPQGTSASTSLTVAPTDTLHITKATFSTSQKLITVNATSTNPQAILTVFLASNNQNLGTMVNQGGGNYTFQVSFPSGTPASVNVKSNLGGSTGQGLALVP